MLTLNRMTGQANKSQDKLAGKTLATGNLTGKLCLKHDQELKSNRNFPVKTGGKLPFLDYMHCLTICRGVMHQNLGLPSYIC